MTRDVAVVLTGLDVMDLIMMKMRPNPGRNTLTEPVVVTIMLSDGRFIEGANIVEVLVDYTEEF